jgi:methyl-accepting chemotaxis protein
MNSIRIKLAVIVSIVFSIVLGLLAGMNYWQAKKVMVQDAENEITVIAQSCGEELGMWLDTSKTELAAIARSPIMTSGNRESMVPYITKEISNNKMYENIYWTDAQGNYNDTRGVTGNVASRPYFKEAMNGKTFVGDPMISPGTGKMVVIISTPIKNNDRVMGVLVGAVNIEELGKRVGDIKVRQTGYAFVLRADGIFIAHPNKELVNKVNVTEDPKTSPEAKAALAKMLKGEKGLASYTYEGADKYLAYAPIKGTAWSVGVTVPVKEATEKLSAFTMITVVIIIAVLIIAAFLIFLIANRIAKPLQILAGAASRIAGGDISVTKINVNSNDELGHLAGAFQTMAGNLRELVQEISSSSQQVASSSQQLTANVEQSAQAATQVVSSITDTAEGIEQQESKLAAALELVGKIAAGARSEAEKTQNAVERANRAVGAAEEGNKAVDTAIRQMTNIRQTVDNSAQAVAELGERSQEIGQIVETISSIAGQTNLLALNAAIEAARAGEQGRGFAVVAEEVRKLAEQSEEAAKQIAVLIGDIQVKTGAAVAAMAEGTQEVKRGTEVVDKAGQAFVDIDGHVKEVASIASGTADGLNQLADNSQVVVSGMREVEDISREIVSQTQTISAAAEEQSASMEEIAASSQHLAKLAEELQTSVTKFKV